MLATLSVLALAATACALPNTSPAPAPQGEAGNIQLDGIQSEPGQLEARIDLGFEDLNFQSLTDLAGGRLEIRMAEHHFTPTLVRAQPGERVTLVIANDGELVHSFTIDQLGLDETLPSGGEAEVEIMLPDDGPVRFYCAFHDYAGMQGAFFFEPAEPTDAGAAGAAVVGLDGLVALQQAARLATEEVATPLAIALAKADGGRRVELRGAELRAGLAELFGSYAYLLGIAAEQVLTNDQAGLDSAREALEHNTDELARLIGSIQGVEPEQQAAFRRLWAAHVDTYIDYFEALESGVDGATERSREQLERFREDAGLFFENVTGAAMPDDDFAERMDTSFDSVTAAVDEFVERDDGAFEALDGAATVAAEEVGVPLASALAEARDLPGVDSSGAKLRAGLTTGFSAHVWLVGLLAEQVSAGNQAAVVAALSALEANAEELAQALGELNTITGPQRERFLALWLARIDALHRYALAVAGGDKQDAVAELEANSAEVAALLSEATDGVVDEGELTGHLRAEMDAVTTAIGALADD